MKYKIIKPGVFFKQIKNIENIDLNSTPTKSGLIGYLHSDEDKTIND